MRGGLLGRLSDREAPREGADLAGTILAHLTLLLNTRQGGSALDPTYGLPDLADVAHDLPRALPTLQRALADAILRFEPRIAAVVMRPCSDPPRMMLSVGLACRARTQSGDTLHFAAVLSRGGKVALEQTPAGSGRGD